MRSTDVEQTEFGRTSRTRGVVFRYLTGIAAFVGVVALIVLMGKVFLDAAEWLLPPGELPTVWSFLTSPTSVVPEQAGIYPALIGSVVMLVVLALAAFPIGIGAAVYLEEYAPDTWLVRLIQLNISNLAGVPSVVYGLLGLALFVRTLDMPYGTVIVGALTVGLLVLPIVIISTQEAIRAVPDSLRQASYGLGGTKWQTVRTVVLPRALPGILTGTILSLGRAIGETAPLIMIGVPTAVFALPDSLYSKFTAMPMQIFAWAELPSDAFQTGVVATGVVTLLTILLAMNSIAIYIRNRYQMRS